MLRAITKKPLSLDSAVVMSSVSPSLKKSCSGSGLMALNGSTAIDGRSGSAGLGDAVRVVVLSRRGRYSRTGRSMFLSARSPRYS
ncbi:hypothetical protein D3C72_1956680 [compost metagenome]